MHPEYPHDIADRLPRESLGDLLARLASDSAGLVRDEIELAKQEMRERADSLKKGVLGVAVSVVLGILALGTLDIAVVYALGRIWGFGISAAVVGAIILIIAGLLAGWGIAQIRRTSLKPDATIRSLREDREWLRRMVGSH